MKMRKKLNKLIKEEYIWCYYIKGDKLYLRYGIVGDIDIIRKIDIIDDDLKKSIMMSLPKIKKEIIKNYTGKAERLENRVKEEINYLKYLSSLV